MMIRSAQIKRILKAAREVFWFVFYVSLIIGVFVSAYNLAKAEGILP